MNRNTELHFGTMPMINQQRSKFDRSKSHKTTLNAGDIIPIYVDSDIEPGCTVQMDLAELVRMATPLYPVADNCYLDTYFFFVPHRLVWEHWQEFWGENDDPWIQTANYEVPQIEAPTGGWTEGTIADYMGIPTKVDGFSINAMPFRAYCKVWNDWFRSEDLKTCCHIYTDETTRNGQIGTETGYSYVTGTELGGLPLKAAKFHGYFTSASPSVQKGPNVKIPLGTTAPVITGDIHYAAGDAAKVLSWGQIDSNNKYQALPTVNALHTHYIDLTSGVAGSKQEAVDITQTNPASFILPNNLITDLQDATAATIVELRQAFQLQRFYEQLSMTGSRYIEVVKAIFGVTSSDARFQRAEYLGGVRTPINMDQIIQTSSTDSTSPQGNTAGFSCTIASDSLFTKSFEEHGTLLGLAVIRTDRTYQQGLNRMWSRKKLEDFYNPFFAHLSNQGILNKELYLQGRSVVDSATGKPYDEEAFGYQEAWAEMRYAENMVSGYMRSNATGSLDVWHYADDYMNLPKLSSDWIDEPKENVDRVIAVSSQLSHQFIADFFFKTYYTRPMPVYSIPGLIDHV